MSKPEGDFRQRLKAAKKLPADEALDNLIELSREAQAEQHLSRMGKLVNRLELEVPQATLLGQATLDYLAPLVSARCLQLRLPLKTDCGGYDQVMQDLSTTEASYVVLFPWSNRLFSHREVETEVAYWKNCWSLAQSKGIGIVQVSYDWVRPGPWGHHSQEVALVRRVNARLREELRSQAFFLDLELVSGAYGRQRFYDSRNSFWTRQPFSEGGLSELARHLAAALRALVTGPKKVLVVDLDNTLWGGEIGEVGLDGIRLHGPEGEAYLAFQRHLKSLVHRGVLLAVASKNDHDRAWPAFESHPDMVLKSRDIVAHEIHWEPKSQSLQRLAEKLRLGLDSFVFFDDNPRERAEIQSVLPHVEVVEVSRDPVDYIDDLERGLYFEFVELTREDRERTDSYRQEALRAQAAQTVEDYLAFLDMRAELDPLSEKNLARAAQLMARTNQFNLTTRRHRAAELEAFALVPGSYLKSLRLSDRFGELGIISVLNAQPEEDDALRIESWVMSCRALQRTVEHCFMADLIEFARESGRKRLLGEYLPTPKNQLVADLYPRLGFERLSDRLFELKLADCSPPETYVDRSG